MEPERESRIDTCVECCVRERDFSQKAVYRCELCERWFCEKHVEPRLVFMRNLNVVDAAPEVRVLYYTEMQRDDGHPDFAYSRKKLMELDIEEKIRSELIRQAMDRMKLRRHRLRKYGILIKQALGRIKRNHCDDASIPEKTVDAEADRKKRVEMLLQEEAEIDKPQTVNSRKTVSLKPFRNGATAITHENKYHYHFTVPEEVYSVEEYRERLNSAKTLNEVERIINDYYKYHRKP